MLPMRDPEAVPLLEPLPEDERFASWHLALRDGTVVGYGAGGVVLLKAMRLTRPAGRLLTRLPESNLETVYAFVARHRAPIGRLVPDRPGPRRFP